MKKKIEKVLFFIICTLLVVFTCACNGVYIEGNINGNYQKPSGGSPSTPSVGDDDEPFTVSIESDSTLLASDLSAIQVIWTNVESNNGAYYSAYCNSQGIATIIGLDGNFKVTLNNLPENFTYNPNIYSVDNDNRDVTVRLYKITPILAGRKGSDWYGDVCEITSTGIYRAVLTADNFEDGIRFQYEPTYPGDYSIESMIDVTANKLNPYLDMHYGTSAFVNPKPSVTLDGGGEENTYTKNFRWEIKLTSNLVGNCYSFRIWATCLDEDVFPINVDFILERDGEYSGERRDFESIIVTPTHDFEGAESTAFADTTGLFRHISTYGNNNGLLDGNDVKYFEDEGYYYVVNSNGEKYKRLYAMIGKDAAFVETNTGSGLLDEQISLRWIEAYDEVKQKKVYYNYQSFIRDYYKAYLYDDIYYPVTQELMLFLQRYSVANRYFNDGNGMGESFYQSTESNQWLFACGYFA